MRTVFLCFSGSEVRQNECDSALTFQKSVRFLEYTDRASSENVCGTNEGLFFDFVLSKGNLIGHLISNGSIFVFRSLMNSALSFSG